jgi:hypothetical protein
MRINDMFCPYVASSSEWIQMDIEEKPAVSEVETDEPPGEETGHQNPASPMEAISKIPAGEMSLPMDIPGGRVVTLGIMI